MHASANITKSTERKQPTNQRTNNCRMTQVSFEQTVNNRMFDCGYYFVYTAILIAIKTVVKTQPYHHQLLLLRLQPGIYALTSKDVLQLSHYTIHNNNTFVFCLCLCMLNLCIHNKDILHSFNNNITMVQFKCILFCFFFLYALRFICHLKTRKKKRKKENDLWNDSGIVWICKSTIEK